MLPAVTVSCRNTTSRNVGRVDQYARIVLGLALVAYAFQNGLSIQGSQWVGLAGFVLLATALFRGCPVYSVLGMQPMNAGSSEPDPEYRALLTIKEIIAPPETDQAEQSSSAARCRPVSRYCRSLGRCV